MYAVIKHKYFATSYHQNGQTTFVIKINEDDILSIIKSLNSNKSHGWDKLSIKMIKMCDKTLVYPLKLIFKASIQEGVFPDY